ncbi:MAG: hypothetical protein JXR03_02950, partial [Cyclobacteriaceae bacterium]
MKAIFSFFLLLACLHGFSQTPGLIYEPSSGSVLDPNGDGYTSLTNEGFQFNDQSESEIPFVKMIFPGAEPFGDLAKGPTGGFGDFVDSGTEDPAQYYFDGTNFLFRLRIGSGAPNSKGYSILIDTDQKFGFTGDNADPDASVDNPGFEVEISFQSNFGVFVYNIDGENCPGTPAVSHAGASHYQKSFALSSITGNLNSFYDFYVPFTDLTGLSGLGIMSSTPMRMVIATNISPNPTVCSNGTSDIGGIDDSACGSLFGCLVDIIDNYTPTSPDDVENGTDPLDRSECPTITGAVTDGATSVTVSTTGLSGTEIKVYDLSGPTEIGTFTTTVDNFSGSVTISAVSTGDEIGASATEPGKSESINNCSTKTVIDSCIPGTAPTVGTITNGASTITVNMSPAGVYDVYIYNADGTLLTPGSGVTNPQSTGGSVTSYAWDYSTATGNPGKVPDGSYYATVATSGSGCESNASNFADNACAASTTPTINTATIEVSTSPISVTAASGASVRVWVNDSPTSVTATGTGSAQDIDISTLNLVSADVLTVVAVNSGGSSCPAISTSKTVQTDPITSDNPPVITDSFCIASAGTVSSVSGTSVEADGTTIQLYKGGVVEGGTTTVSSGAWTINTGVSFSVGDVITATATVAGGSESAASSSITVQEKTANAVAITTSPIEEGATTISGTGTDGDVISLYVDGIEISITEPTVGTSVSGEWTISGLATFVLYSGAQVTVTANSTGLCESDQSASVEVSCKAPTQPNVTSANITYCNGSSGEYMLTTSESLVLYEMVDNTGASLGIQAIGTGSSITLLSNALTADLSNVFIKATSLFDASCFSTSASSFNFTPADPSPTIDLTSSTLQVVGGSTSADLAYTNAQNSPTNYEIDFSILAENQGFMDVTSNALGASPISIVVPASAAIGTYPATLTITSASLCESQNTFSIEIYTAGAAATIDTNPTDLSRCSGESAFFSVVASNAQSYQWQVDSGSGFTNLSDGGVYSGVTSANLSISDVSGLSTFLYRVNVTGFDAGVVASSSATLTEISLTPGSIGSDQTISSGATPVALTSSSGASGSSITYQWKSSEDNVSFSNISGATSDTYAPGALTVTTYYKREATNTVSGYSCSDESNVVTITVNPPSGPDLTGLSTSATDVCINTASTVTVSATSLADGAYTVNYTLAGANAQTATDVAMTISGGTNSGTFNTPVLTSSGTTNLTINSLTVGGNSTTATMGNTDAITVDPNNTATLSSAVGTDNQTVCINTAITNITYTTTGATGIGTSTGLPAGVSAAFSANTITISGTPTTATGSPFSYSIPLTGGCGTVSATGTIAVTPDNTATLSSAVGTDNQTVCINTAITNITYTTTGATGIGTPTGLPAGVNAVFSANTITVSGTPSASGTFNYSIPLTGGCGTVSATGTIAVTPDNTATLSSAVGTDNQTV